MDRLKKFWQQINEPPLNPQRKEDVTNNAVGRVFWKYFLKPHWSSIVLILILASLGGAGFKFFLAWTARYVADDIVQVHLLAAKTPEAAKLDPTLPEENRRFSLDQPHERTSWSQRLGTVRGRSLGEKIELLWFLALLLVGVVALNVLGGRVMGGRRVYVGQKAQFRLRYRVYEKLHNLPMSYHDSNSVGSLMTHLFSDVREIQNLTLGLLQWIPVSVFTMVIGVWIMFSIDPVLAGLVLLGLPTYGFSYTWFHRRQKTVARNLRERQGRLNGHITNRIKNFYLVKSFVRETAEAIDFLRRTKPIIRDNLTSAILGSMFSTICTILTGVCMVMVLWLGALRVRDGRMTLGELLLFYSSAGFMFSPVASIGMYMNMFHRLRAICQKVMRVLDEPITLADPEKSVLVPAQQPEIAFQNVTLQYSPNRPPAVRDLSFSLPAGKTLCVMGPSGCGKTTLAKLACRIYDPTEGTVCMGGTDIRRFKLSHLRRITGYVTQEPVIFDGTIQDNIRYASEHRPFGQIISAARYAQIHDYIVQLPDQYDTLTCERGLTLSGGQKQRMNLARVLLYDPKVLVLDDCTSSLDAETEAKLIQGFDEVLEGRTVILISHRISIAMRCDYVLMLDGGRMVEMGPPEDLLEQDGAFRRLLEEQTEQTPPTPTPEKRLVTPAEVS